MFKLFWKTDTAGERRKTAADPDTIDPLSHPDLKAMSLAELADLPLMPENLGRRPPPESAPGGRP